MNSLSTESQRLDARNPAGSSRQWPARHATALTLFTAFLAAAAPAQAVDGCQVLLCLAAPSWRAISQCVPTITQLMQDLARGKPFPICSMSGDGNVASHTWAHAPTHCPPQYTRRFEGPSGTFYTCDYDGAVLVHVNGRPFTRTWWTMAGDSVTEFSAEAKAQLGSWDTRFDDEYSAWAASQPPIQPTEPRH